MQKLTNRTCRVLFVFQRVHQLHNYAVLHSEYSLAHSFSNQNVVGNFSSTEIALHDIHDIGAVPSHLFPHTIHTTGGEKKLCRSRVILPVADNIFKRRCCIYSTDFKLKT